MSRISSKYKRKGAKDRPFADIHYEINFQLDMTHVLAWPCCPDSDAKGDKGTQLMLRGGLRDLRKDGTELIHNLVARSL